MYDENEFNDEIEETLEDEDIEKKQKDTKKKTKNKKSKKTKRKTKVKNKTKKEKPKTKVVYKEKEKGSGCLLFILILIILGLLAVIGYLVYINYYEQESTPEKDSNTNITTEKICEAKATKFSISSGLNKCSDKNNFKLKIIGTDLSFDVTRTNDNRFIINNVYYKNKQVNAGKLIGKKLDDKWQLKDKDNILYFLVQEDEDNQILTVIDNGEIIYQNSEVEYNLNSGISYIKYTALGLQELNTCEYYETSNLLDSTMWTKGDLVYENGQIIEKEDEVVTAKDVCKK